MPEGKDIKYAEEYYELFKNHNLKENEGMKLTLEQALDTRKFEIELYWKRATYFWGFLIVIFGAYFAVWGAELKGISDREKVSLLFLINCLGFIFSYSWFLVNKGSKYWQKNWEKHVDMLEDQVIGKLYKTLLEEKRGKGFSNYIIRSEEFSVSKVNQILSFFIVCVWVLLGLTNIIKIIAYYNIYKFEEFVIIRGFPLFEILTIGLTIYAFWLLTKKGKSGNKSEPNNESYFKVVDKTLPSKNKMD